MSVLRYAACCAALLASSLPVNAQVQLPAAPQVTIGAELKYVRFDWSPVAGAAWYQLEMKVGSAAFSPVGGQLPASVTKTRRYVAVHREDWANTRYRLTACNASGCTPSSQLNPAPLMLDTIGYFKASNTEAGDLFGRDVVISDDGLTLAVAAQEEASNATGVNGNQADNSSSFSGAVYIFRGNGSVWRQEAYLKPPVNLGGDSFGTGTPKLNYRAIALSRNGSLAVIGAPAQHGGNVDRSGAVHVFERGSTGWRHTGSILPPEPQGFDYFGLSVDLSLDGKTLKITSMQPQDPDTSQGVNTQGRTHIYQRVGSTWQRETTIAPFYAGDFCPMVRMSTDGGTLVASCYSLLDTYRAVTYKRIGGAWVRVADLALGRYNMDRAVALNHDGTAMALGVIANSAGAVGVYRWGGAGWVSDGVITQPAVLGSDGAFGWTLAFDRPGNQLAIGAYSSRAAGAGVSSTVTMGNTDDGAVFLYRRSTAATSPWRFRSLVKAPNPGNADTFGLGISLSGSGKTLAVGALREDSKARGVHGNQADNSATDAGAAYLY